jgi:hypothetical protein
VVASFNSFVTTCFSLALAPLAGLGAVWGLLAVSIVAGVILVVIYGYISNQSALKRVKKRITAGVYESVLFRHDLRTSLRAQLGMLVGGFRYFALAVPPLIVLLIPSLIILAQLNLRYGARALQPGERAIVRVDLAHEDALFTTELSSPTAGVTVTPPLRDLDTQSVSWRIDAAAADGRTPSLALAVNGVQAVEDLFIGAQPTVLPTARYASPWLQLLYPGAGIPESLRTQVRGISITYPEQELSVAGIKVHWLLFFALISISSGLVASKVIGIEV